MGTTMHTVQISVDEHQYRYLTQRAKREGVSVADLVRRMVQQEAEATERGGFDQMLAVAGIDEAGEEDAEGPKA